METLRVVYYHTNHILRGSRLKIFLIFSMVSLLYQTGMEYTQLVLETESRITQLILVLESLISTLATYIVSFLFIKAVRGESFHKSDLTYALSKVGIILVVGIILSFVQMPFMLVIQMFSSDLPFLMRILGALCYASFLMLNAIAAYAIYDDVCISQILSGTLYIIKEHLGELFMSMLFLMVYYVIEDYIMFYLTDMILGVTFTTKQIIASALVGDYLGTGEMIMITIVNLVCYLLRYALMLPIYTYAAKLYNDEYCICMPSGQRNMSISE